MTNREIASFGHIVFKGGLLQTCLDVGKVKIERECDSQKDFDPLLENLHKLSCGKKLELWLELFFSSLIFGNQRKYFHLKGQGSLGLFWG